MQYALYGVAGLLSLLALVLVIGIISRAGINPRVLKWSGGALGGLLLVLLAVWLWPAVKPAASGSWSGIYFHLPNPLLLSFVLVVIVVLLAARFGSPAIQKHLWGLVVLGLFIYCYPTLKAWVNPPTNLRPVAVASASSLPITQVRSIVAPLGEFSTESIDIPPACDWDIQVTGVVDKLTPSGRIYPIWPKNRQQLVGERPVNEVGPCRFRTQTLETQPATVTVSWTPWSQERISAYWREHH